MMLEQTQGAGSVQILTLILVGLGDVVLALVMYVVKDLRDRVMRLEDREMEDEPDSSGRRIYRPNFHTRRG